VEFKKDLNWWLSFLGRFNGTLFYRDCGKATLHTDACDEGAGMFVGGIWHYVNWKLDYPCFAGLHINYKEVMAAVLGILMFAPILEGKDISIITDSTAAKGILNKGRCKSPLVMHWLRILFWRCTEFGLRFRAIHCPGLLNQIPDAISRLNESGQVLRLHALLNSWFHGHHGGFVSSCPLSMSSAAFQVVQPHLARWHSRLR
jgi:hypothetical protein